jgi:Leucine-rich repeat (LRR) protein
VYEEEEEGEEEGEEYSGEEEEEMDPRKETLSKMGLKLDQADILELVGMNASCVSRLTDAKRPKGAGHAACNEQCGKAASDAWVEKLAEAMKGNTTLTELSFGRGHQISGAGVGFLTTALEGNTTIQKLSLTFGTPGLQGEGTGKLAAWLGANASLTILDLTANSIKDGGVAALSEAIKNGATMLKTLMLSTNQIGEDGASALGTALENNNSLTSLTLTDNQIGNNGTVALAEALKKNTTLSSLMLDSNQIKAQGASALAEMLRSNATLTRLSLESHTLLHDKSQVNDIDNEGTLAFAEMLRVNKTLRFLNLNDAGTHAESVRTLAKIMDESNETLLSLKTAPNMDPLIETICKRNMTSHRAAKKWLRKATSTHDSN